MERPRGSLARIVRRWCRWQDWVNIRRKRVWLLLAVLAYTLAGFFLLPWIAQRQLTSQLGALLQRPVQVDGVRINPWLLSVEVTGVRLTENGGEPIAAFDRLFADLQLSSLWHRAWVFREITLQRPVVELVRFAAGDTNLQRLLPPAAPATAEEPAAELPRLRVASLLVSDGELGVLDQTPVKPFATRLAPVDLRVEGLSTLAGESGRHTLAIGGEAGLQLAIDGEVQLNPLSLSGSLRTSGPYPLLAYRYAQDLVNARLARGGLDLAFNYRVTQAQAGTGVAIDGVSLALRDLLLEDKASGAALLGLESVRLAGGRFEWPEQRLAARSLQVSAPSIALARLADGTIDWQHLLAGAAGTAPAPTIATDREAGPAPVPWQLRLDELAVNDMAVRFEDRAVPGTGPVTASDLDLRLSGLSNAPGASFPLSLSATLVDTAKLALDGQLSVLPQPELETRLQLWGLPLTLAQPYLDQVANVLVDGGALHLDVQLASHPQDPLAIRGALEITGLETRGKERMLPLLAWQRARIDTFDYSAATNVLGIAGIVFNQPYFRLRVNEDRSNSLRRLLIERAERAEAAAAVSATGAGAEGVAAAGKPFTFRLGPVTLVDGTTDFSDLSLPIPFATRVTQLNGATSPLDIASREPMSITLEGKVADYGLARVEGSFLALAPLEHSWLNLAFRNVALPDLSPYTIRFAGHQLAGGRMDVDLRYVLEQGRLKGDNNVILRDVELGPKVPYEGAMDLPLGLAIALLKGPDGRIDVDLPVEGDVNDPKFRIGGVIWTAIGNLVTRAVTAPFRLLGALVGMESEEFEQVIFAPGEAAVTPPEREKLAKLAEAMAQRPQLALRIPGTIAEAEDAAALREIRVDQAIGERLGAIAQPGDSPEKAWRQRREVLEELFAARYPDQPLDAVREGHMIPEDPAKPEGERRLDDVAYLAQLRRDLVAAEVVPAEALQQLAGQRAAAVAAELAAAGVETERVRVEAVQAGKVGKNGWIGLEMEVEQR